jgi:hexosaminidase
MHLDIARNYNDLAAIKKLVDGMAFYKLNKLHLHLTDDEGWRLEIPGLPELTEVGAQRGYTSDESDRLAPAYGSGADGSKGYGSGYLTRAEFIELLQYATRRHIEVIPELNVPGHARAAVKAMEARYRKMVVDNDQEVAAEFRLADPQDQSEYRSVQNYPDNVICVCCEGTYRFYEKVVDEVRAMFTEAGAPLITIHTGGDEVPAGVWLGSPECEDLIREDDNIKDVNDLPTYFFGRIQQILEQRGLKAAGWEEVAMLKTENGWVPNPAFVGKDVIPYVWNNLWGNQDLANRLANAGYPVVLCNVTNLYFDLAYSKDPLEPGLYWGGFIDTRKAFDLRPFDVLRSTVADPMGNRFDQEKDYANMERLRKDAQSNILGIQGQLWSESIKGPEMLEYYYFPKMLGLAERAWTAPLTGPDSNAEWEIFANELGQRELDRLNYLSSGYNYRLPPPGAKAVAGKIEANTAFPGLIIRYTTDGSEPEQDDPVYSAPLEADSLVCLKTFDPSGRSSRMVCLRK